MRMHRIHTRMWMWGWLAHASGSELPHAQTARACVGSLLELSQQLASACECKWC